ncbi:hypothetical protein [Mycobacterium sp. ACS4331]|uniref:hypothetical protein n=1 Tax=Mycobacterium sp. ACS4331 TaxID=1834121 RepID=UPI0007FC4F9D|nr:hypothetical protein [Mycobacterium sp. ACS4331]OBF12975.1 hypothetical protein A5727_01420 [Mycobacterium sp. ACS4331]
MITQTPEHQDHALRHEPPAVAKAAGIVVGLTLLLSLIFIAFALPAAKSKPNDVTIGIAGPPPAVAQIQGALDQNAAGGFAVSTYADQGALRTAIRNRDVYGGISIGPQGPTLLTASGASPTIAQMLGQIGAGMAQRSGMPLHTEDLAPLPAGDPRGVGLAAAALPLALAGLLPGIVLVLAFRNQTWLQIGTLLAFSAVASVTITALLQYVFDAIESNFWGVTAGLFLGTTAIGLVVLGLGALFGRIGIGIAAAVALLLGNPLSGINSAPEMLPSGWGAVGQLLPQGANATLLRSTAFFSDVFPDPRATTAIVVLGCWAVAGVVLIAVAALRRRRSSA